MLRTHDCAVFRSCHNSEHSNVVRECRIPTEGKVPVPVDDNQPCDSRGKAVARVCGRLVRGKAAAWDALLQSAERMSGGVEAMVWFRTCECEL